MSRFHFLAFNELDGQLMAHGASASDALFEAYKTTPDALAFIFEAGDQIGQWLWVARITLRSIRPLLSCPAAEIIRNGA